MMNCMETQIFGIMANSYVCVSIVVGCLGAYDSCHNWDDCCINYTFKNHYINRNEYYLDVEVEMEKVLLAIFLGGTLPHFFLACLFVVLLFH